MSDRQRPLAIRKAGAATVAVGVPVRYARPNTDACEGRPMLVDGRWHEPC